MGTTEKSGGLDPAADLLKKLSEPLPKDAAKTVTKGARGTFTYLEGWYVMEQLNDLFGQNGWRFEILELKTYDTGKNRNQTPTAGARCLGRLHVTFPDDSEAFQDDVGHKIQSDNDPMGAIEGAEKGAVTDCIKRAARHLGDQFGNKTLYAKEDKQDIKDRNQPAQSGSKPPAKTNRPGGQTGPALLSMAQQKKIFALFNEREVKAEYQQKVRDMIREKKLTKAEATKVIDRLIKDAPLKPSPEEQNNQADADAAAGAGYNEAEQQATEGGQNG